MYNLFLDDVRMPHQALYCELVNDQIRYTNQPLIHWDIVRSYDEFIKKITEEGLPNVISFDHDLAVEHYEEGRLGIEPLYNEYTEKTGYDCLMWLINYCRDKDVDLPKCYIHTFNPVGKVNMFNLIRDFIKNS